MFQDNGAPSVPTDRDGDIPRRKWQYGLKSLFLVFVAVGLVCMGYRWGVRWEVARRFERAGHLVFRDGKWCLTLPHRSRHCTFDDVLVVDYVEFLDVQNNYCTSAELRKLKYLPRLRELELNSWTLWDEHLESISTIHQLETIDLSNTEVGVIGMQHLAKLPRLRRLKLQGCRIAEGAYAVLGSFTSLEELDLSAMRPPGMTATEFAHLRHLPKLRTLSLSGPQYSGMLSNPATLDTLAQMPALEWCCLLEAPWQILPERAYRRLRAARPRLILELNENAVLRDEENPEKTTPLEDLPENVRL